MSRRGGRGGGGDRGHSDRYKPWHITVACYKEALGDTGSRSVEIFLSLQFSGTAASTTLPWLASLLYPPHPPPLFHPGVGDD